MVREIHMQRFLLTATFMLATSHGVLPQNVASRETVVAQSIVGTWQGTLPTDDHQRIVLKIVKDENGILRASSYRPGTGLNIMPMSSFTFTPPTVETAQVYAGMSFRGKLSADGKSLEGTWTAGKQTYPLTLALTAPDEVWKPDYTGDAAMAVDADPSFDVATIKPTPPDQKMARYGVRTRAFKAVNQSASDLICYAYHLRARQIEGLPAWANDRHFDIAGKPDMPGQPSEDQYRLMLRKLLAERFNLKAHPEQKVFSVYALTVEKNPPPLTKSDLSIAGYHTSLNFRQAGDGQFEEQFAFYSMPDFADVLMNFIRDRQIVDETGLKGRFDFTVKIPLETGNITEEDVTNALFQAVHTLGFKLVPKKEPIQVLIVDHVEQPSPN